MLVFSHKLMKDAIRQKFRQLGQTLVEVVVALGIVVLLVTGLIAGATSAIHGSDQSRVRSLAIIYAQEALELSRQLRDNNWSSFQAKNGLWCLDKGGNWSDGGGVCSVNIGTTFTRSVTFLWVSDPDPTKEHMNVTTIVSWQDGSVTRQTQLTTYFTQWQ